MKPTLPANPYPKNPGFGLRVHHTEKALRKLAAEPWANIYSRGFDNCFENGDGDAVVFALMHKAYAERSQHPGGYSELAEGIGYMFRSTVSLDGFPPQWEAIAWPLQQSSLFDEQTTSEQFSLTF